MQVSMSRIVAERNCVPYEVGAEVIGTVNIARYMQ